MRLSEFDYFLPDELIAQKPSERREGSRMLVVDRARSTFTDDQFANFPTRLTDRDVLVVNNTRVFPARLFGRSETGAAVEIFLIAERTVSVWEALARPARRLPAGKQITFAEDLTAAIVENHGDGRVIVEFNCAGDLESALDRVGQTPLPPYIKRSDEDPSDDRQRYQTVYARSRGAIAAPTAGLHFTENTLNEIRARGTEIVEITLHVGYGTFEPVRVEDLSQHSVMPERYEITEEAATALNNASRSGRRIIAVGTTTTRTVEAVKKKYGEIVPGSGMADLTITPGYEFAAVGALLTNFHLPKSSLLVLVSTFAGHELIMKAYQHAVAERYRFYSYGDCMFIE